MKRRKKLWIACAALVVLVALCTLALAYRPAPPYRFLQESRLEGISNYSFGVRNSSTAAPPPPKPDITTYRYVVEGSFESVAAEARKELTDEENWEWSITEGFVACARKPMQDEFVAVHATGKSADAGSQSVIVTVTKETTLLDRVLAWMHNR